MSMTDLERELRATLIAAGERAPVVDDLAIRVARPVRRRRTGLVVAAAVAAVAAIGLVITVSGIRTDAPVAGSTPGLTAALIGTWRPVKITGYNGQLPRSGPATAGTAAKADISFTADGRWTGSDGCNGLGGTYKATDHGSITTESSGLTTAMGCANVPNLDVLENVARFTIEPIRDSMGRSLRLYAADGHLLATYQRV
jgi:hypothetical protein